MSRIIGCGSPILLGLLALAITGTARGGDAPAALIVRFVRPDQQLDRFLALFEGAAVSHPAAALAAWRQATGDPDILSKGWQAAIAAQNPEMVRELRTLDDATLALGFDVRGWLRWNLAVPHDDGTLAALAPALALTDGASEPPLGEAAVDRLGPPGSPLLARRDENVIVAGNRDGLADGLARLNDVADPPEIATGWLVRLDPEALAIASAPDARRIGAALIGLGVRDARAEVALEGDSFTATIATRLDPSACGNAMIDPSWLNAIPAKGVSAAFALAIDPAPETWDRLFAAADRVEKSDPTRADAVPLRARLNLLANAVGVRPEVEIWPQLRGISGFVTAEASGRLDGVLIALHATDEATATRWADRLLPRLARRIGAEPAEGAGSLGAIAGRPLLWERRGATVRIGWGEAVLARSREALANPDRSAGPGLRANWGDRPIGRFGAVWPGRPLLPRWRPPTGSPLANALVEAPPILWWGEPAGPDSKARDVIRWDGLRGTVHRLLDQLPLEVPRP